MQVLLLVRKHFTQLSHLTAPLNTTYLSGLGDGSAVKYFRTGVWNLTIHIDIRWTYLPACNPRTLETEMDSQEWAE